MERYNKVLFALLALFSAVTFAILVTLVLNSMAALLDLDEMVVYEGVAVSFLLTRHAIHPSTTKYRKLAPKPRR